MEKTAQVLDRRPLPQHSVDTEPAVGNRKFSNVPFGSANWAIEQSGEEFEKPESPNRLLLSQIKWALQLDNGIWLEEFGTPNVQRQLCHGVGGLEGLHLLANAQYDAAEA